MNGISEILTLSLLGIVVATLWLIHSSMIIKENDELRQEIQSLKEIKGLTSNPKLITPQPNQPIEIGKVGNRTFFLANLDGKECISVIALNMSSYFICGDEPKLNK